MHVLPFRQSTLQGTSNRLCGYKARCSVDYDNIKMPFISTVYIAPKCHFKVKLESSHELEHLNFIVLSILIGVAWPVPLFEGVWMERSGRWKFLLFEFIRSDEIHVPAEWKFPRPVISLAVVTIVNGSLEVPRGS